jgi:hypothetical protein
MCHLRWHLLREGLLAEVTKMFVFLPSVEEGAELAIDRELTAHPGPGMSRRRWREAARDRGVFPSVPRTPRPCYLGSFRGSPAAEETCMADKETTSFMRSLCMGVIEEDVLLPFPVMDGRRERRCGRSSTP